MAIKILNRANACVNESCVNSRSLFMVRKRSHKDPGYAISFIHGNKIFHIKINSNTFNLSEMNGENSYFIVNSIASSFLNQEEIKQQFFSIDNRHFLSIAELINFYKEHTLDQYLHGQLATLGTSYREALPTPKYVAIASEDFVTDSTSKENLVELKKSQMYFVIREENIGFVWAYLFDVTGLVGYAPKKCLDVIF